MSQMELERRAAEAGHAWRTVRRAADDLNVRKQKLREYGWCWVLPEIGCLDAKVASPEIVDKWTS